MSNIILCQVSPLEQSQKFEESGVVQESVFYWLRDSFSLSGIHEKPQEWRLFLAREANAAYRDLTDGYSAYTVAELQEMFLDRSHYGKAAQLADVLISLIESGSVGYSIKEVNQRLRMFHEWNDEN
jgi:hypothetical protein